jgi:lysophospholipase L1-like esterase
MRRFLAALFLVLFGLSAGFIAVEIVLRATDPQIEIFNPLHGFHVGDSRLGWRGKPNIVRRFHRADFDALVEHDADGFRRPDPPRPEHAEARVLFLGDSFTWGWGVSQGEVFSDQLQHALAPRVAIYNRGISAFGTAQEYLLLEDELRQRSYAAVGLLFFNNDLNDNIARKEHAPRFEEVDGRLAPRNLPLPADLQNPIDTFIEEHSRAFLFFNYQFAVLKKRLQSGQDDAAQPAGSADIDYTTLPGYAITARLLAAMQQMAQQHGARFSVIYVPSRSEMESQPAADPFPRAVHQMVVDVCSRDAIPVIDLVPRFYEETARGKRLTFPTDAHWNADGHRLTAEILLASAMFDGIRYTDQR